MNPNQLAGNLLNPSVITAVLHILDFILRIPAGATASFLRREQGWGTMRAIYAAPFFLMASTSGNRLDTILGTLSALLVGFIHYREVLVRSRRVWAQSKPLSYPENATLYITTPFLVTLPGFGHRLDLLPFYNGKTTVHFGAFAILTASVLGYPFAPVTAMVWGISALSLSLIHGLWYIYLSWTMGAAQTAKALSEVTDTRDPKAMQDPSATTDELIRAFGTSNPDTR